MNAKEALKMQFHFFYLTAKANLEGMNARESLRQPDPGGNCANWIVGHLVSAQNGVMGLVNEPPVLDSPALERAGPDPITSLEDALDWEPMVAALIASEDRLMAALDALGDDELDEGGFTDPFGNQVTRGEFLNILAFHQSYHAGQLGLSRRLAGLPGAIRGPRPQEVEA
jgi:hypothetical protein